MSIEPSVMVIPMDNGANIRVTVEVVEPSQYWWWHNEQDRSFWTDKGEPVFYQQLPDPVVTTAIKEVYRVWATGSTRRDVLNTMRQAIHDAQYRPVIVGEEVK